MSLTKVRTNEVERTPTTNDIVLFRSSATRTRKPGLERKYMNSDKAQKKSQVTT